MKIRITNIVHYLLITYFLGKEAIKTIEIRETQ